MLIAIGFFVARFIFDFFLLVAAVLLLGVYYMGESDENDRLSKP